jgi:RNA polymerase sigma-70 factor (ECF subfamily)
MKDPSPNLPGQTTGAPADPVALKTRLSQISTAWTLIVRAHGDNQDASLAALTVLVDRYQTAVYRYLVAAVRDADVAADLFQEFALRLVRGDFGRVDSSRGRFRDYLKTALINLVINHQRKQKRTPVRNPELIDGVPAKPDAFDADEQFLASWRKALLDKAWESLAAAQTDGPPFYTVLFYRMEHPELTGAELAEHLSRQLRPAEPFTDAGLRKTLQRAREKFTDLLLEEVARSLPKGTTDELEQELIDLGFYSYCRRALERWRKQFADHSTDASSG